MIREVDSVSVSPFSKRIEYFIDEKSVGYLEYSLIYDRIEVDNIFVNENNRNMGIGSAMMEWLVNRAIELDVVNITLEVRASNEYAIKLYKKNGFYEVAIRKQYYGNEDGILMEKQMR